MTPETRFSLSLLGLIFSLIAMALLPLLMTLP